MISINVDVSSNIIFGAYGKTSYNVPYDKERLKEMKKLQKAAEDIETISELTELYSKFSELTTVSLTEIVETKCQYLVVNPTTEQFFLKHKGVVSKIPIPKIISDRIITSVDKGIDFMPIVKMWIRWLRNEKLRGLDINGQIEFSERLAQYISKPFINQERFDFLTEVQGLSTDVATRLSSTQDVSITQEGLLCTHKVVQEVNTTGESVTRNIVKDETTGLEVTEETNEDRVFIPRVMGYSGDAFNCMGENGFDTPQHFVKVGCVHSLDDWNQVDCDDNRSCVPGLHLGGLSYVSGYQGAGSDTLDCLLDPAHIGAIADGDGAIRCIQYFVYDAWKGTNGSIYHSSTYAEMTDEQWDDICAEDVEYFKEAINQLNEEIEQIEALKC